MKRTIIMMALLSMFCLTLKAQSQYVPEGATQLYYSYYKRSGYGDNVSILVIYKLSTKYYLRQLKGFSGAASPVKTKEDKIYHLPDATMELSNKQLEKIRELIHGSQIATLSRACVEEEQRNIDTGYTKGPEKGIIIGSSLDKDCWQHVVEWPDVLTGVNTEGVVAFKDYKNEHHQQRNLYLKAVSELDSELKDIIGKYIRKNIKRLWREYQNG